MSRDKRNHVSSATDRDEHILHCVIKLILLVIEVKKSNETTALSYELATGLKEPQAASG